MRRAPSPGPLRVVIDARLMSGVAGGVEGVVVGLASGLSQLDGPERYSFAAWEGAADWLTPYLAGKTELVSVPRPQPAPPRATNTGAARRLRRRVGDAVPALRSVWQLRPNGKPDGPPRSDPALEALQPDVIHFPFQHGFITRIPTIFHPHDLQHVHLPDFFTEQEREHRELWYGTLCRRAAMVAVASRWAAEDVRSHFGLSRERVRVVPLAPPTAAFETPNVSDLQAAAVRLAGPSDFLLYPAQTWAHKNHIGLLQALARIRQRDGMALPIVLTGRQSEFWPEIVRTADELGVTDQVHSLGFVGPADLLALYARARAVVVPSLFEAASAPLWEAFRAGVPAACSNVTSLPEQAGDAAVVFDPRDIDQMADAIRRVWTDEDLRSRLKAAGGERIRERTWLRTASIFRAHYRRLAKAELTDDDQALIRIDEAV